MVTHIRTLIIKLHFLDKGFAMATSLPWTDSSFIIFDHFSLIFLIFLGEMSFNLFHIILTILLNFLNWKKTWDR